MKKKVLTLQKKKEDGEESETILETNTKKHLGKDFKMPNLSPKG